MINSLNFNPNLNINAKVPLSQRTSVAMHTQLQKDQVCFRGLNIEKACKTLLKKGYDKETYLTEIRPVKILNQKSKKEVEVYLAKACNPQWEETSGLAVFLEDGEILGDIETLDKYECHRKFITSPSFRKIGKYLRVSRLNASYKSGYKGVGTALIQAAAEESKKLGLGGQLRVKAYNDMDFTKGSPIPFYAKMGFVLYDNPHLNQDEIIKEYQYDNPLKSMFLLSAETLAKLRKPENTKEQVKPSLKELLETLIR